MKTFVHIVFGAALSAAVLRALWTWLGPAGLALGMPVLCVLAIPLVEIVSKYPRFVSRLALRGVEGRYFAYRGRPLDIDIDEHAICWVSTADVRKVVPGLPVDAALARLYAGQAKPSGDPWRWRITVEALSMVLAKSTDAGTARFAAWLEKDVAQPARRRLERGTAA